MPPDPVDTLETLLERGEVTSALLLKGDYTGAERDLIQRAYSIGLKHGDAVCRDRADREKERADFAEAALKDDAALNAAVRQRDEQHAFYVAVTNRLDIQEARADRLEEALRAQAWDVDDQLCWCPESWWAVDDVGCSVHFEDEHSLQCKVARGALAGGEATEEGET